MHRPQRRPQARRLAARRPAVLKKKKNIKRKRQTQTGPFENHQPSISGAP
jgi:hypothetical protein